ncbi:hypothetical protein F220043C3_47090 [Enterocloster asparagiformis]
MERSGSHRKPEDSGAKRRFLPFLCIAKRVTGNGVYSNRRRSLQAAVCLALDISTKSDYNNEYEIGLSPKGPQGGNGFGGETAK